LQEFKFLRQTASSQKLVANQTQAPTPTDQSRSPEKKRQFFDVYSGDTTPFDEQNEAEEKEDFFAGMVCYLSNPV